MNEVQTKKTNVFAIVGFICSLAVSSTVGIILSIIGLTQVKECNDGKGFAIAGIIIGIARIILSIIILVLYFLLIIASGI